MSVFWDYAKESAVCTFVVWSDALGLFTCVPCEAGYTVVTGDNLIRMRSDLSGYL